MPAYAAIVAVSRRAVRLFGVLALVALVTVVDYRLLHANSSTAGFSYLLVILGLATRAGLEESIAASLASVIFYNLFFLPPVGTLTISDPQNWVALCVFLITAVTASHLSSSARKRADEASARRQEMERLYDFSRALMLGDGERSLAGQIAQRIVQVFGVRSVAFYDSASDFVYRSGVEEPALSEAALREVARSGQSWKNIAQGAAMAPVCLGGRSLGSLGVVAAGFSDAALSAVAQLSAIVMERSKAQQIANRAEATRENAQLKGTLLDALAHEFKTPLTSIKAAITTVLSQGAHDRTEQELLTIVDEETDHLTGLVTEAIEVARIEAGHVSLRRNRYPVASLVSSALYQVRNLCDGRDIQVDMSSELPDLDADPELSGLALRQIIANALKYAPASAVIRIVAEEDRDFIVLHVSNAGPGIPVSEQEAIFERFYRGQEVRERIPGTGMGLTIAREIVQAHGGRIWVQSRPGEGVQFSLTLPKAVESAKEEVA